MNKIIGIYGEADEFKLEFTQVKNGEWTVSIPIDTEDGRYVTNIYAVDSNDKIVARWIGILYVSNGISHLHILEENFSFWLLPERKTLIELKPQRFEIILKKECDYHGS